MDRLAKVRELVESGRFADAFQKLAGSPTGSVDPVGANILKAELLERLGTFAQSRTLVETLLRSSKLGPSYRSRCELVLGLVNSQRSARDGISHFQKAVALARQAGDTETLCWALLRSMSAIVDSSGADAANSVIRELRNEAVKLGNPVVLAALHVFLAQIEAKRGLLKNAKKHANIGESLLNGSPNVWLEAIAENTLICIALLQFDFETAFAHAERALRLANECGGVGVRAMTITNYGNLLNQVGRFEEAIQQHQTALRIVSIGSEYASAALESIARTRLIQGQFDECAKLLDEIRSFEPEGDALNYVHRYTELTRAELLARSPDTSAAAAKLDRAVRLARDSKDPLLLISAQLLLADIESRGHGGRIDVLLEDVANRLAGVPPEFLGRY